MSSRLPKRFLNIVTMRVEMYEDIRDELEDEGYVCISHVWGMQKDYTPESLKISGIDWNIPLSSPEKLVHIKKAVQDHKMIYCWLDLVCLPQGNDREHERAEEIPYMGDYYKGARITFVLETHKNIAPIAASAKIFSSTLGILSPIMSFSNIKTKYRMFEMELRFEHWFKRVWTFQEALFSKKLIYATIRGSYHDLTDMLNSLSKLQRKSGYSHVVYEKYQSSTLSIAMYEHGEGKTDLLEVLHKINRRRCIRPHDKIYAILSVLEYKTFPVTYNITMEDLNKSIIKYACSKGDISWLAIGGNIRKGFIQPLHERFNRVGRHWKYNKTFNNHEDQVCDIKFNDNTLCIDVYMVAEIQQYKCVVDMMEDDSHKDDDDDDEDNYIYEYIGEDSKDAKNQWAVIWMLSDIVELLINWGFTSDEIAIMLVEYNSAHPMLQKIAHMLEKSVKTGDLGFFTDVRITSILDEMSSYAYSPLKRDATVVDVRDGMDKRIPLIVSGNADVGDKIMLTKAYDHLGRTLGIVTSGRERKGVCLYPKTNIPEHSYFPYEYDI